MFLSLILNLHTLQDIMKMIVVEGVMQHLTWPKFQLYEATCYSNSVCLSVIRHSTASRLKPPELHFKQAGGQEDPECGEGHYLSGYYMMTKWVKRRMKRLQQTIVKMWMNLTPQIIRQVRLSGVHCETVVKYVYNKFHQHKFHFSQIYCDVSSNSNMFNGIKQCDCVLFSSDEHDDDQIPKMSRNNRFINSESKKCVILLTAQWKN